MKKFFTCCYAPSEKQKYQKVLTFCEDKLPKNTFPPKVASTEEFISEQKKNNSL